MNKANKSKEQTHNKKFLKASINKSFNHKRGSDFRKKHKTTHSMAPYEHSGKINNEYRCIMRALSGIPRGTSILNWPCGCSRLLQLLKSLGYNVTSIDFSQDAVRRTRFFNGLLGTNCINDKDDFKVVNIFQTDFDDDFFGAALINQLFTCLPVMQMRQMILNELRRICFGPIIVSFFCNTMIYDHKQNNEQESYMLNKGSDFCLNRKAITEEVQKCGLAVKAWIPKYGYRTRRSCAILVRND